MPALEAMSLGIPVVASRRGGLPALVADAGVLVEPDDVESIVAALDRVVGDDAYAAALAERGMRRARQFQWRHTAAAVRDVFRDAIHACAPE